jgi:hypothetical protein
MNGPPTTPTASTSMLVTSQNFQLRAFIGIPSAVSSPETLESTPVTSL